MKQLKDDVVCKYCYGCNKLLLDDFDGVKSCKYFIQGINMIEYYKLLRERKKEIHNTGSSKN